MRKDTERGCAVMRILGNINGIIACCISLLAVCAGSSQSQQFSSLFKVESDEKFGFADRNGKTIVPPQFDDAGDFSEGLAYVAQGGKYGFLDSKGNLVIKPRYQRTKSFSEGRAAVRIDNKWGFIDRAGQLVIPATFYACNSFSESLALVLMERPPLNLPKGVFFGPGAEVSVKSKRLGYIDLGGKVKVTLALEGEVRGKVTKEGFDPDYIVYPKSFSEGLAPVLVSGQWGFLDTTGNLAIPPKFKEIHGFSESVAGVQMLDSSCGFIDKTGNMVIPGPFQSVCSFSEGTACVEARGKWGYIDGRGKAVIPYAYDEALPFSNGYAAVKKGSKWGYIDAKGSKAISFKFDLALPFGEGLAKVFVEGKQVYIDKTGKQIISSSQ
ncbi:MAG: hypothetical protein H6Q04_1783 [Acidobacteria bacterium]|nr:hypothetical protein [Acidobacteriota bacterium]